jgi:glycosyltransferase involved in cell wall biosynthesis
MPRIGMNPMRGQKIDRSPARITLAVLTYLPQEIGYFEHRFDVTRLCIESLIANTPQPYDLMVFDNGSCPLMKDYLVDLFNAEKIQHLVLARHNVGKLNALQSIFKTAPGEIVAYTDDDVFFLPGWLEEHLKILENYPDVGLMTGFYIRSHMRYATKSLEQFAERDDVQVEQGNLVPVEVEEHYAENMGRTWDQYQVEVEGLQDIRFDYKSLPALASAGHHQFVAYREVVLKALPQERDDHLMGKMVEFETRIDELGCLRLSTNEPVTRLLGNVVNSKILEEARTFGIKVDSYQSHQDQPSSKVKTKSPLLLRRILQSLYNQLHHYLYSERR